VISAPSADFNTEAGLTTEPYFDNNSAAAAELSAPPLL
jgi:hypothetical protein